MEEQIQTNGLSPTMTSTHSEKGVKDEQDGESTAQLMIPPPAKYPWEYKGPALGMVLVLNCTSTGS